MAAVLGRLDRLVTDVARTFIPDALVVSRPLSLENTLRFGELTGFRFDDPLFLAATLMAVAPETVLPLGFEEVRFSHERISDPTISASAAGAWDEEEEEYPLEQKYEELLTHLEAAFGPLVDEGSFDLREMAERNHLLPMIRKLTELILHGVQYRTPDGVWHPQLFVWDRLVPQPDGLAYHEYLAGMREAWAMGLKQPDPMTQSQVVFMPTLWSPSDNSVGGP